jgi:hypothetical protein
MVVVGMCDVWDRGGEMSGSGGLRSVLFVYDILRLHSP